MVGHELDEHVAAGGADGEGGVDAAVEADLRRLDGAAVEDEHVVVAVVAVAERVLLEPERRHVQVHALAGRRRQSPRAAHRRRVGLRPVRGGEFARPLVQVLVARPLCV